MLQLLVPLLCVSVLVFVPSTLLHYAPPVLPFLLSQIHSVLVAQVLLVPSVISLLLPVSGLLDPSLSSYLFPPSGLFPGFLCGLSLKPLPFFLIPPLPVLSPYTFLI